MTSAGIPFTLTPGMGCQRADHVDPHRSAAAVDAKRFIVD